MFPFQLLIQINSNNHSPVVLSAIQILEKERVLAVEHDAVCVICMHQSSTNFKGIFAVLYARSLKNTKAKAI